MRVIKQSTAKNLVVFMTDSTDHVTGKTGLTLTITASKDGGSFSSITPTVTELATGWYNLALTTTHTNTLGDLALHITATGADPSDVLCVVDEMASVYSRLGAPAGASVSADVAAVKTDTAAIKAKTDNLPSDPADASDIAASFTTVNGTLSTIAGYIDTEVAAIKAKTDNLPSDPADASDIAAAFTTVNGTLATIAGYIDTEVSAIKAKTDNLPSDPADASDIAAEFSTVNSTLSTIAGYIDTEVAAIKAKTDNIPTHPASRGIKSGVAVTGFQFPMLDSSTGDPATGLTVTCHRSIDGGAFATSDNSPVELSNGWYAIDLSAADMTGRSIALRFSATGAKDTECTILTEE